MQSVPPQTPLKPILPRHDQQFKLNLPHIRAENLSHMIHDLFYLSLTSASDHIYHCKTVESRVGQCLSNFMHKAIAPHIICR